jgi:hypothetical protein
VRAIAPKPEATAVAGAKATKRRRRLRTAAPVPAATATATMRTDEHEIADDPWLWSHEHGAENVKSGLARHLQQGKYLDRDESRAWRASESVTG